MKKNIVLIGFMGTGKTSTGQLLSELTGYQFIDSDSEIEKKAKMSIRELFEQQGEEAFRQMETEFLKEANHSMHHTILATGGGMPLRTENTTLLHDLGSVVLLKTSKEVTYERLKQDRTRPLLLQEDPMARIEQLLKDRLPVYEAAADLTITTDGLSPLKIALAIISQLSVKNISKE